MLSLLHKLARLLAFRRLVQTISTHHSHPRVSISSQEEQLVAIQTGGPQVHSFYRARRAILLLPKATVGTMHLQAWLRRAQHEVTHKYWTKRLSWRLKWVPIRIMVCLCRRGAQEQSTEVVEVAGVTTTLDRERIRVLGVMDLEEETTYLRVPWACPTKYRQIWVTAMTIYASNVWTKTLWGALSN